MFAAIIGMAIGAIAPILRRRNRRGSAILLALGAAILLAVVLADLVNPGGSADRGFGLFTVAGELPAFVLALISLKWAGKLYWVGWGIHMAMSAWLTVVIVWLLYFWHW